MMYSRFTVKMATLELVLCKESRLLEALQMYIPALSNDKSVNLRYDVVVNSISSLLVMLILGFCKFNSFPSISQSILGIGEPKAEQNNALIFANNPMVLLGL